MHSKVLSKQMLGVQSDFGEARRRGEIVFRWSDLPLEGKYYFLPWPVTDNISDMMPNIDKLHIPLFRKWDV